MLGASCQRIGAAAFVLLQMLGVRCRHIAAGGGVRRSWRWCDRPCCGLWCEVTAEIRYGSDRDDRGEFVLAAGLAASGRACG
jgi:hypothetical protein